MPSSVEPWLALSLMAIYEGNDSQVISASNEVLSRQPANYAAIARLASAEIRTKSFDSALKHANEGLKLFPTDATLVEEKAAALKNLGQTAEARAEVQRLILLSPANLFAKDFLAHDKK